MATTPAPGRPPPTTPIVLAIVVGGRADVVVLDPSSPSLTPSYDAHSTVAYAAARGDVRWVVAGGKSWSTTAGC